MPLKDNYSESYGAWAGNPRGAKPDFTRCCESVHQNYRNHQCSRKNGHGPDGAYCKTHDPEARMRREEASAYAYHQREYESRLRGLYGAEQVIRAIAGGHNDPRTLAQEWLDKMGDRLTAPRPPAPPPPPKKG